MKQLRDNAPKFLVIGTAVLVSLLIGTIFICIMGCDPWDAYHQLLIVPLSTLSGFGEVLTNMTPLLIVGIGMAVARCAGLTNLGGEGQIYMGALAAVLVCNSGLTDTLGAFVIVPAVVASVLGGALWGAVSGALKAYWGANEIITSLLLNYIAVNFIGYLIRGPLQEPTGLMPESAKIEKCLRLAKLIPMTRAHVGFLLALALIPAYYVLIYRSRTGYHIRTLGNSVSAAHYGGVDVKRCRLGVMALSGGLAGLGGCIEILGVYYRLTETMAGNIGFTAVVAALLGMLHPIGILLAGFLLSLLTTGAQYMQVVASVPVTLVSVLQGLIVLFVLFGLSFRLQFRKKEGRLLC